LQPVVRAEKHNDFVGDEIADEKGQWERYEGGVPTLRSFITSRRRADPPLLYY